ncbi:MAG: hypothetical protein A3D26_01525 [Candidatus Blackburnbacteria bacterium RIFCSPHIGHO2_02_FULL_44_20]|uniref:YYY membrane protein n=1 Tax=Candidatus Blackburnbacteria bacterium RIFCSPHIGHO2_02_FULL_44_20 TaxID=1797516 RepID=A0A1G1V617_9BACT|nr:MAG: hypothetical protein A3D26_01525 [Candidatus Blackburnbacteria bacterium RIFCSPHIGHO2_02_FULL_44_20]OGY10829.1 MAG: hypothetical protein A3E16_04030 [Candidatus Blackburnbacteria bacterium RIFCSPHIGHO2_12_FULL_44_25]OGY15144.1 MAG: hypothetical protein A3A62_03140 [Candidatus Blackburnbacteria bacterium RIFCSPLOWO2_01_FULL_44_43]
MTEDLLFIFRWWLLLFEIGLVSFPLSFLLFSRQNATSYILGKGVGVILISYISWLLASLRVLPFSNITVWLTFLIFALFQLLLFYSVRREFRKFVLTNYRGFIFQEILFFVCLLSWSLVRGYQPDIRGLEKFMDFGLVNAILQSNFFPPQDMWFSGNPINYYYFGHFITAFLTQLSGIPSYITYNLMIATIFSLTFSFSFAFARSLFGLTNSLNTERSRLGIVFSFATSFLVSLGGNPHFYYWLARNNFNFSSYWYPDATRFIVELFGASDNTIHEFPAYSFVVADLHGHLLNLPFVLLFLTLMVHIFLEQKITFMRVLFLSFLLGSFVMTSTWDVPIYLTSLSGIFLLVSYSRTNSILLAISKTVLLSGVTFFIGLLFSLPFLMSFRNISGGVKISEFHSPLWMLGVLWGLFGFLSLIFLVYLVRKYRSLREFAKTGDALVLCLVLTGWLLVVVPEVVYVKDIYIHEYQRANTMFKLTYQSFVLFSLTSFYILWRVFSRDSKAGLVWRFLRLSYLMLLGFVVIGQVTYSYLAVKSYYGLNTYKGIAGNSWVIDHYPGEGKVIDWFLPQRLSGRVVLQAAGDSYTDFGLISSYTGLPTVQGWLVHEWLWRGSFEGPGERARDVEVIYTSQDRERVLALITKYDVLFVVVGALERQKYPTLEESKFKTLGKLVFSSFGTQVYRVN